jgi:hypothetical protein
MWSEGARRKWDENRHTPAPGAGVFFLGCKRATRGTNFCGMGKEMVPQLSLDNGEEEE